MMGDGLPFTYAAVGGRPGANTLMGTHRPLPGHHRASSSSSKYCLALFAALQQLATAGSPAAIIATTTSAIATANPQQLGPV